VEVRSASLTEDSRENWPPCVRRARASVCACSLFTGMKNRKGKKNTETWRRSSETWGRFGLIILAYEIGLTRDMWVNLTGSSG